MKGTNTISSPTKTRKSIYPGISPSKKGMSGSMMKPKMTSKVQIQTQHKADIKDHKHVSPTSMQMQNTFIIQNADESFDAYWAMMRKKRATGGHGHIGDNSAMPGAYGSPGQKNEESNFGFVEGIQPTARDGHVCEVSERGQMFVFGGDRHHMPFNDLYVMKL